jgi:hypothetical protein
MDAGRAPAATAIGGLLPPAISPKGPEQHDAALA